MVDTPTDTKVEETEMASASSAKGKGASRRQVLMASAGAAAVATTVGLTPAQARGGFGRGHGNGNFGGQPIFGDRNRVVQALSVRVDAARDFFRESLSRNRQKNNGDEKRFDDLRGSYHKAFVHNDIGEVDPASYNSYLRALNSRRSDDFENIILDETVRGRSLVAPQAAFRFELTSRDNHQGRIDAAPKFDSLEAAAEMGEVYAMAALRDVPFTDFETSNNVANRVDDLNAFSQTVGPKENGLVTPATLFRGETPGDLEGPYISQFLLRDVPFGNAVISQRYAAPQPRVDFMTDFGEWLGIQRGFNPDPLVKDTTRYIHDGRTLGEFVHIDITFQAYLYAALILNDIGATDSSVFCPDNPYLNFTQQEAFVTFGIPDIADLVTKAANVGLAGAWWQKWAVHRRLRPEVYGGRLHNQLTGVKDYGLSSEIADSRVVERAFRQNGTFLLPMAFPEGSPTHPAYPAGHSTNAGACATVLKAFFNEDFELTSNVQANRAGTALEGVGGTLTVGGEINKLAANIALGRDYAGVHYRSDGIDGINLGEQFGIDLLRDYSRTYNERFNGFTLTKFNGQRIRIKNGRVQSAGA